MRVWRRFCWEIRSLATWSLTKLPLFGAGLLTPLKHSEGLQARGRETLAQQLGKGLRERWAVGKGRYALGYSKKGYIRRALG